MRTLFFLIVLATPSSLVSLVDSLTLTSGQRIAPRTVIDAGVTALRPAIDGTTTIDTANQNNNHNNKNNERANKKSLFDLPSIEAWGTERGLKEHHLKTLYRVIMRSTPMVLPSSTIPSPPQIIISNPTTIKLEEENHSNSLEQQLLNQGFPKKHLTSLLSQFTLQTCSILKIQPSNGGCKFVIQLPNAASTDNTNNNNNNLIETVLIRHERHSTNHVRYTVCVSSQVGCAKKCSFCATGTMGLVRQLTGAEILEQVFLVNGYLNHLNSVGGNDDDDVGVGDGAGGDASGGITNIVYMGMGEPLDNYPSVHESLRGLTHQCLFGLKQKKITVSTVGASSLRIRQLADDAPHVCLAISLHSALQESRIKLIPSANGNSIEELGRALDYHAMKSGRGAMIEYLLIDGVNDGVEEVDALVEFCLERNRKEDEILTFVNLIPYNPTLAGDDFGYETPSDERIYAFHERLKENGVKSLIRWSSATGRDANGACGQLALSSS